MMNNNQYAKLEFFLVIIYLRLYFLHLEYPIFNLIKDNTLRQIERNTMFFYGSYLIYQNTFVYL